MPEDDYCEAEFIDGSWGFCGCSECQRAECDAIEADVNADVEAGALTETEALDILARNGHLD